MSGGFERDDGEDGGDSVRVAEYALGLLEPAEHAALARRIATEPALAAELRLWQQRLAGLDEGFAEAAPPPAAWRRLETRLFAEPAPARGTGWWESLAFWRGLAASAAAVAVIAIGLNLALPRVSPEPAPAALVAALEAQEGSGVSFVAFYDTASSTVRLVGLSGEAVAGRDYELWYIRGEEAPVSMGVVPVDQRTDVQLDPAARGKFAEGTVLAVSLEQQGGSPTGAPQGPIVALGRATAV